MNGQTDLNRQSNFIGSYQTRRVKNADSTWMSSVSRMRTRAHHVLKSCNSLNNKQSLGNRFRGICLLTKMIAEVGSN